MDAEDGIPPPAQKSVQKHLAHYTIACGCQVRSGRRQSMPSRSIDSCARVSDTVPVSTFGQMKRPRSSRLANRQRPSPSYHNSLIRSPRRPRKTNTCPENGFVFSAVYTIALSPMKPRRRSVMPATIQMRVPLGIIGAATSAPSAAKPRRGYLQSGSVHGPA
jgi:hypothetical protein